jgi:hypothetical protein
MHLAMPKLGSGLIGLYLFLFIFYFFDGQVRVNNNFGNRNNKLALLYESNRKNMVAVNTAVGMTERVNIANIDILGKKCRD